MRSLMRLAVHGKRDLSSAIILITFVNRASTLTEQGCRVYNNSKNEKEKETEKWICVKLKMLIAGKHDNNRDAQENLQQNRERLKTV